MCLTLELSESSCDGQTRYPAWRRHRSATPIDARHTNCRSLSAKRIVLGQVTHSDVASLNSDLGGENLLVEPVDRAITAHTPMSTSSADRPNGGRRSARRPGRSVGLEWVMVTRPGADWTEALSPNESGSATRRARWSAQRQARAMMCD
jgi:hypothetical protein